jgi:sigma-B regulation protein RsbU (phosphoserine phosphatase)
MAAEVARVLIVDDSLTNRLVLENYVKALGYQPEAAVDGVAALEHIRRQPPDLVLLDIIMPKMDGYEVLSQLKADAATRDLPVIMISGIDEMESVVRCIQQGAEDYLPRPINTTLLRARAGASLEKKRLRDEEKRKTVALGLALEQLQEATQIIQHEVEHIAAIQRALLPQTLPAIAGLEIAASYATFGQAGGDLYDFIPMGDRPGASPGDPAGPWGILVADASGHGPAAAVLTAMVNAILRAYPTRPAGPAEVLSHLNRHLVSKALESSFVTAFFGIFDPSTRRLVYALAGHDPPIRKCFPQGGTIERLPETDGMPLGIMDDNDFTEQAVQLAAGEYLFLFTDGISEAASPEGTQFGLKGIMDSLAAPMNAAQEVLDLVNAGLKKHQNGIRPQDDQTMVAIRALA